MNFLDSSYRTWLGSIKKKIKKTQLKVAISANAQLIEMYWDLGKEIILKQKSTVWGRLCLRQTCFGFEIKFS